jgi:hypothetical protein
MVTRIDWTLHYYRHIGTLFSHSLIFPAAAGVRVDHLTRSLRVRLHNASVIEPVQSFLLYSYGLFCRSFVTILFISFGGMQTDVLAIHVLVA